MVRWVEIEIHTPKQVNVWPGWPASHLGGLNLPFSLQIIQPSSAYSRFQNNKSSLLTERQIWISLGILNGEIYTNFPGSLENLPLLTQIKANENMQNSFIHLIPLLSHLIEYNWLLDVWSTTIRHMYQFVLRCRFWEHNIRLAIWGNPSFSCFIWESHHRLRIAFVCLPWDLGICQRSGVIDNFPWGYSSVCLQ